MTDLSFIIPAYNETRFIGKCLSTIKGLCEENKLEAEIIVIDNGSTDDTVELARAYTDQIYTVERHSVSFARNVGIEKAHNRVLAFIDADVVLTQKWFDCYLDHKDGYLQNPDFLTGHQYAVRPNGTWIEKYWFGNIRDRLLNGGNIITSKKLCERIGGFDITLKTSEDYDFCTRAISAGANYIDEPGYIAIHEGFPRDIPNFFRREYWHGEGDYVSWRSFLTSITAILGVAYLVMLGGLLLSLIGGYYQISLIVFSMMLVLNMIVTLKRFGGLPILAVSHNFVLSLVYFVARGLSLFKALRNRGRVY